MAYVEDLEAITIKHRGTLDNGNRLVSLYQKDGKAGSEARPHTVEYTTTPEMEAAARAYITTKTEDKYGPAVAAIVAANPEFGDDHPNYGLRQACRIAAVFSDLVEQVKQMDTPAVGMAPRTTGQNAR